MSNSTPPDQRHGHDPDDLMAWRRALIAVTRPPGPVEADADEAEGPPPPNAA